MRRNRTPDDRERLDGMLRGVQRQHAEHETRRRTVEALRRAEVLVVGDADGSIAERLGERLRACGGRVVSEATAETRFVVAGPQATRAELERLDAALLVEAELLEMLDIFDRTVRGGAYAEASRRARKEARERRILELSTRPAYEPEPKPARRMVRGKDEEPAKPRVSDAALEARLEAIEQHARQTRAAGKTGPFRDHRAS
jgi:hypothetical protein